MAIGSTFRSGKAERPETWVTVRTGHMGYTFRFFAEGVDAVEREFGASSWASK